MNKKSILCVLLAIALNGCLETDVKDETTDSGTSDPTTPTTPSTSLSVVPYYQSSYLAKAEVYFDANGDNVADDDEYLGTTDSSGEFKSDTLNELYEESPSASVMVHLENGTTQLLDTGETIDHSVWLSYDLEQLTVAVASTTTVTANVNAMTTWIQALVNNEGYTVAEAQAYIDETLSHVDSADPSYLDYDDYYLASYLSGLEAAAASTATQYCCVNISMPEFTKVATKISWSYDEILERGDEPDTSVPPVFEYDSDGNLVIEIPSNSGDDAELERGTYDGNYPGDGEFINEEGQTPTSSTVNLSTASLDINRSSDIAFTSIDGELMMAFTNKSTGIPNIATLVVDPLSNNVTYSTNHEFPRAGFTEECINDNYCRNVYYWPNSTRDIKAFNSWGNGDAILSVHGPTLGAFVYSNGSWSNWVNTNAIHIWEECRRFGEDRDCTSYDSHYNYLDTVYENAYYGPTGFYDYEKFGNVSDNRLTFRGALRVHRNGNQTVGEEGDFTLITTPVYTMSTFRAKGSIAGPLFGWYNEREDSIRGLAIKQDGEWQALADTTYDMVNTMYSNDVLEPKASAIVQDNGEYLVASTELDPIYDVDLNIEGYRFYVRKYDSTNAMWWQSWLSLPAGQAITSMDVVAFMDGGVVAATCDSNNLLTLYRWSSEDSISGIGLLESHDTQESCSDVKFLSSNQGDKDSVVLVNGNMLYGISSDGGYIKLSSSVNQTEELKWFSLQDSWVLSSNSEQLMVFAK